MIFILASLFLEDTVDAESLGTKLSAWLSSYVQSTMREWLTILLGVTQGHGGEKLSCF